MYIVNFTCLAVLCIYKRYIKRVSHSILLLFAREFLSRSGFKLLPPSREKVCSQSALPRVVLAVDVTGMSTACLSLAQKRIHAHQRKNITTNTRICFQCHLSQISEAELSAGPGPSTDTRSSSCRYGDLQTNGRLLVYATS